MQSCKELAMLPMAYVNCMTGRFPDRTPAGSGSAPDTDFGDPGAPVLETAAGSACRCRFQMIFHIEKREMGVITKTVRMVEVSRQVL
jgi:hypothetical protein